ncbi:MAG: DUF1501 domain-containing protein [Acetobacteraceae bacterium]
MTTTPHLPAIGRRGLLLGLAAVATLGNARLALGQAPGEPRLVVILLRGALDGLDAVVPYGDPAMAALRGDFPAPEPGREGGLLDLGGFFGLHPALPGLHGLYRANEAAIIHAVAGPYRTRSHFEAQDLMEAGAEQRLASGWLNRALGAMPTRRAGTPRAGLIVGLDVPLLMRGPAPVGAYAQTPETDAPPELIERIQALYRGDPVLARPFDDGVRGRLFAAGQVGRDGAGQGGFAALAGIAGRLLAADDGPRVAALEIGGWDTHANQRSRLPPVLRQLDAGFVALKEGLGAAWSRTAVLAITEFGRTARVNGTLGTDHGTAGVAFLAGGAIRGGRVIADWPGVAETQLLQRRDLAATRDLRAIAKGLLRDHLRLPNNAVAAAFPGSETVRPEGGLLRG